MCDGERESGMQRDEGEMEGEREGERRREGKTGRMYGCPGSCIVSGGSSRCAPSKLGRKPQAMPNTACLLIVKQLLA